MSNYKIVRIAGVHSFNTLEVLLRYFPDFETQSYEEQIRSLFQHRVLYSDSFSRSMCRLGHEAHEIVWDFEVLQKRWASEKGLKYDEENWIVEILIAQLDNLKPDVIYLQGTELAIPRNSITDRSTRINMVSLLKDHHPSIRFVVMFSGFPSKVERVKGVDLIFSGTPYIQEHYKLRGVDSLLCYHAFDCSLLEYLGEKDEKYNFTFVGSTRAPESRYWALMELLQKSEIEMWIDETEYQVSNGLLDRPAYELRNFVRSLGRNIVKRGINVLDEHKLKMIASSSRTPNRLRSITQELWSDRVNKKNFNVLKEHQHPRYRKFPSKSLREMYPSRCHEAVVGLEYYRVLRDSKLTFNKHTDQTGSSVGNMRLFETTGVGTCLVTDTRRNMFDLFEPDYEILTYCSIDEAIEKVDYILADDEKRRQIAFAGQKKVLKSHTIFNRCQLIDEAIQARL